MTIHQHSYRLPLGLLLVTLGLSALTSCSAPPPSESPTKGLTYVIHVNGPVDRVTLQVVSSRIATARAAGAETLVLSLDTTSVTELRAPIAQVANEVFAARQEGIRTVAWVEQHATGWGAVLALACGEIFMAENATIGNAWLPKETITAFNLAVRERVMADIIVNLDAWSDNNTLFSRNVARAMVDGEVEVTRVRTANGIEYWTEADFRNPPSPLRADEGIISREDEVLNLNTTEALLYDIALDSMDSIDELVAFLGADEVIEMKPGALDGFVRIVSNPFVSVLLIALGCLGLFIEAKSPGFGVGGTLAIVAFGVLFVGHYLSGMAEGWEILLFIVGVILIAIEIFLIPGFGFPGALGVGCLMASLFLVTLPEAGSFSFGDAAFNRSLIMLLVGLVLPVIAFSFLLRVLPHTPFLGHLVLKDTAPLAPEDVDFRGQSLSDLEGKLGTTVTMLRPSGRVEIDGEEHDVTSTGDLIEAGERIVVERVQGHHISVRSATDADVAAADTVARNATHADAESADSPATTGAEEDT